jgi:hypothetical protein
MKWFVMFSFLLFASVAYAQHDIKALFYNPDNLSVLANSCMYEGEIEKNTMRFRTIPSAADGEIVWKVTNFKLADSITYSLRNTTANFPYSIVLANGKIQVREVINLNKGNFVTGDSFKIVRCKNSILYFHNGVIIHTVQLANNTFPMIGEVVVSKATDTGSELSFHAL